MSGGHQQAGLVGPHNASGSSINTKIPGCTHYRCAGQQVWSGALSQLPEDLRDSWSWESPDQMTEGFLPARGLPVQGLGWEASQLVHWLPCGAQRLAHTLTLGHLGTIPLGSKEEPDATPKTSVSPPPHPWCHPRGQGQTALFLLLLTVRAWTASHSCGDWILWANSRVASGGLGERKSKEPD